SVLVRYPRELRDTPSRLERVLVSTPSGAQIPIAQLADIKLRTGPSMLRDENALLAGYVFVDFDTAQRDVGGYVEAAKRAVNAELKATAGYTLTWSGQFENMTRVRARMKLVVPLTLVLIFLLLYANTKSSFKAMVVMLAVPFSLIGAVWLLWVLHYNVSIAV